MKWGSLSATDISLYSNTFTLMRDLGSLKVIFSFNFYKTISPELSSTDDCLYHDSRYKRELLQNEILLCIAFMLHGLERSHTCLLPYYWQYHRCIFVLSTLFSFLCLVNLEFTWIIKVLCRSRVRKIAFLIDCISGAKRLRPSQKYLWGLQFCVVKHDLALLYFWIWYRYIALIPDYLN